MVEEKKFYWADAVIDGETVVVSRYHVLASVAERYAWASNPVCNLYNKSDMPALPFRKDSWLGITQDME